MLLALIFAFIVGHVGGQSDGDQLSRQIKDNIRDIFEVSSTTCSPGKFCIPGFVEVPSSTTESGLTYLEKCGEGNTKGKRLCVNYDYCDLQTDTIKLTRIRAGTAEIDIGKNVAECGNIFARCCKIPEGGLPPDFNETSSTPPPSVTTISPEPRHSFASTHCGIRNENGIDVKIKGNNDSLAEYGEFPWMVALINNTNPSSNQSFAYCGGSLISPNVVLTVAHCVLPYKSNPDKIKVRVGEWNSKSTSEKYPYQERNIANIILYTGYQSLTVLNDVALLILERPVDKDVHIGTICLPNQGQLIESSNCFMSGWGETIEEEHIYIDILKKVNLPMVPGAQCQEILRKSPLGQYFRLHESLVCAGGEEAKDGCSGDGGSPLVCPDPNNPQRYVLAGMVVAGIGCGEKLPAVYANVAKFRPWIDYQMQNLNLNTNTYIS